MGDSRKEIDLSSFTAEEVTQLRELASEAGMTLAQYVSSMIRKEHAAVFAKNN